MHVHRLSSRLPANEEPTDAAKTKYKEVPSPNVLWQQDVGEEGHPTQQICKGGKNEWVAKEGRDDIMYLNLNLRLMHHQGPHGTTNLKHLI